MSFTHSFIRVAAATCAAAALTFAAGINMPAGKVELKSAGALAMGPDGILFVGDSVGGKIVALDVDDRTPAKSGAALEIKGINEKIAAMLGTAADQILIQDVVVNPTSKNVYIAVSRGRGADAVPVILRAAPGGKLSEVSLASIKNMSVALLDSPTQDRQRMETITQLKYVDGKVLVAGLSNEEFSSSLRAIPYPFQKVDKGAGIEIWHGSHGRFETNAPVRTFVPYEINHQTQILAAYTCTPLVQFPIKDLAPGAKIKGKTVAELGNRNRPLDMIVYQKDGKDYLLLANSSRGVMKISTDKIENADKIESPVSGGGTKGQSYETISSWTGVDQLDKLDQQHALVLRHGGEGNSLNLESLALP